MLWHWSRHTLPVSVRGAGLFFCCGFCCCGSVVFRVAFFSELALYGRILLHFRTPKEGYCACICVIRSTSTTRCDDLAEATGAQDGKKNKYLHNDLARAIKALDQKKEDSKLPSQPDLGDLRAFQPMHGLKLVIKEDVMPQEQMPHFPALEKLAANGFLLVETWNNKRAMLNFKATVEVPMLGTMIESCGDTLDESHTH